MGVNEKAPVDSEIYTIKDIENLLGVSRWTAARVAHDMPHIQVGRIIRVRREAFEAWMRGQERRTKKMRKSQS